MPWLLQRFEMGDDIQRRSNWKLGRSKGDEMTLEVRGTLELSSLLPVSSVFPPEQKIVNEA